MEVLVRLVAGVMFSPRGGSAHVARALNERLAADGHEASLVVGSVPEGHGDAAAFYRGLDVCPVVFGRDAPMHPSYEDREGAVDPCFATVDAAGYEAHVAAWATAFERAGASEADVLHLHHLTPLNEAAHRVAPSVPIVGHIHGTELLMLETIAAGPPAHWCHADVWASRMRGWANRCERLILPAKTQVDRAVRLLDVPHERCVVVSNGVDAAKFAPGPVDRESFWHEHLVRAPRGWLPGAREGSLAYNAAEIARLVDGPVFVCCGRFTAVKRIPLLVEAWAAARQATPQCPASLVILGGHPGEWEGEHPHDAIERTGARDVFLAGWHSHADLPNFFRASDALVMTSAREQFGLVLVEAMASGIPCLAVDAFGPSEIVEHGRTGWLVPPDDATLMTRALVEAFNSPDDRARRGAAARKVAIERYGWGPIGRRVAEVLSGCIVEQPWSLAG